MGREPIDAGTPELNAKRVIIPAWKDKWSVHMRVMDSCEADRMLLRRQITPSEHHTLQVFERELLKAGYMRVRSIDWREPMTQVDPAHTADRRAGGLAYVVKMIAHLDQEIGRKGREAVVGLVMEDAPSMPALIRKACESLDRFFQVL